MVKKYIEFLLFIFISIIIYFIDNILDFTSFLNCSPYSNYN